MWHRETRSASDFRGNRLEKRYDALDVTPSSRLASPFDPLDLSFSLSLSMIDTHIFTYHCRLNNH